jgi:hypothetical protein
MWPLVNKLSLKFVAVMRCIGVVVEKTAPFGRGPNVMTRVTENRETTTTSRESKSA